MPNRFPKLYQATEDIPSIAARRGDRVLDDGKRLYVMHRESRESLERIASALTPILPHRLRAVS